MDAVYLSLQEMQLIQAAMRDSGSRRRLLDADARVNAALTAIGDSESDQPGMLGAVARRKHALTPAIERYLAQLDRHDLAAAGSSLDEVIEPGAQSVAVMLRTLLDPAFPGRVADLLCRYELPAEQLCIEITGYTVISDPATAIAALRRLRDLGVKTSLDDYGTGYSSMAYLKSLPLDELKIDQTFVIAMTTDPGSHALVVSTVELGHNLGLSVTAEGVEDEQTGTALIAVGCDFAQGYHFARPQPADQLARLLRTAPGPKAAIRRPL